MPEESPTKTIISSSESTPERPSRAWVFAGGEFQSDSFDSGLPAEGDLIVGVDHGISHCLDAGLVPDVMMGDFDSVDASILSDCRLADVPRKSYPARKNSSDLELTLEWLSESGVEHVILIGVSGGRSDHHLINWLLASQQRWTFAIEMIDATVHAHVVTPQHGLTVSAWVGQTVSLTPLPDASGVCTAGLEYPLHDAHLSPGTSLGLSNVASCDTIGVSIKAGRLLVFRVKADMMHSSVTS